MYSKADLVEFLKWNSNAPVAILKKATVEELEAFIKRNNAWDSFITTVSQYRECRQLEQRINAIKRECRQLEQGLGIR